MYRKYCILFNTYFVLLQQSQKEIIKLKEGEEKQRRAREAREKAEAEKAARAARKRALVDMNAHETQEGVMDSLMEALQTGSAFSRPDQRRKRQTRVAGGKFSKATYVWRKIARKNQTAEQTIVASNLCKYTKLTDRDENVISNETTRCNTLSSKMKRFNIISRHLTPDENQKLYKQVLITEAERAPKKTKHLSRITFFKKKKQCNSRAYYTMIQVIDETPRRDVPMKVFRNLESRCDITERESSPFIIRNAVINEARVISPIKQKHVIVGKMCRRNSIVRRAIINRKHIRATNTSLRRLKFRSYLKSPSDMSTTMPLLTNSLILDTNTANIRMSKSVDNINSKISKKASTSIKLLRSKNFENLTRCKDENQNILDTKDKFSTSNISIQFPSSEHITKAQSLRLVEISGVNSSETSPLHVIKTNHFTNSFIQDINIQGEEISEKTGNAYDIMYIPETSNSSIKSNFNKLKTQKHKLCYRNWRFWQIPKNSV